MEWIFWIGIVVYAIVGEIYSRRYEHIKKKQFSNEAQIFYRDFHYDLIISQREKDRIALKGLVIFFLWPLYLLYVSIRIFSKKLGQF